MMQEHAVPSFYPVASAVALSRMLRIGKEKLKQKQQSLYWQQRSAFLMRHRYSDEYLETQETYAITGTGGGATAKTLYVVADKTRPPIYLRRAVFWALCFIGLAWPVRLFIESK